jgi:hypothetical protein
MRGVRWLLFPSPSPTLPPPAHTSHPLRAQILRRTIEVENSGIKSPAVQWLEEDWNESHDAVVAMQDNLCRLGVVRLICVLLGNRCVLVPALLVLPRPCSMS